MSIYARTLSVTEYRSFPSFELDLARGVTVLVGHNAVGKTNLVEALQLLTSGRSFRKPSPRELVRAGGTRCSMKLTLEGEGRVIDMGCVVEDGKRSFMRNGKRCRAAGVRGVVPSVLFCPDDLDLVKRGARLRREALDGFGIQLNESYAQLASTYERTVEQRNSLLKEPFCTRDLLDAWNDSIASTGAALTVPRLALLSRIREHLIDVYAGLSGGEAADVSYVPSWGASDAITLPAAADASSRADRIEAVRARIAAALDERAGEELRRGITLVGPHRDEVAFTIDGRDARTFASQGQQRSLVLAWKIAEVEVTREILGRPPLLLLDDVMSELDETRRQAFLGLLGVGVQTVITTTNLGYFDDSALERAKVVKIGGGSK